MHRSHLIPAIRLRAAVVGVWLSLLVPPAAAPAEPPAGTPLPAAGGPPGKAGPGRSPGPPTAGADREAGPEAPSGWTVLPGDTTPSLDRPPPPRPDPLGSWRASERPLAARAESARMAALQLGASGFDPAARALVLEAGGRDVERLRAAVLASPDLPLARAALASALLREEQAPVGAARNALSALHGLVHHPEAQAWLEAVAARTGLRVVFASALVLLVGIALRHARAASHDLGDALRLPLPPYARLGLLALLLLSPALLGQGLLGLALGCFALSVCVGTRGERRLAWLAAATIVALLGPATQVLAPHLLRLGGDPVADAVQRLERGLATPVEIQRLEQAGPDDDLAARGLAVRARRAGRHEEAAARYDALLEAGQVDPALLNNAANVALARRHTERALSLYESAAEGPAEPLVLYNLSHAYGEAIRPQAQDEALRRLEVLDEGLAFELTQVQAKLPYGSTLDLPTPIPLLRGPASRAQARALARGLAGELAPGALGGSGTHAAAAFLAVGAAMWLVRGRFRVSSACARCGARACPRCDPTSPDASLCVACHRLLHQPETADPARREERLDALARREAWRRRLRRIVSLALPGAAGLWAGRPGLAAVGALGGCLALACLGVGRWRLADPLAAGGAATLLFALVGLVALVVHLLVARVALRQPEPPA